MGGVYKRAFLSVLLSVMVFSTAATVFAQPQQGVFDDGGKQILIVVGPQYGLPISNAITAGIFDTFTAAGMSVNDIFVEFLDLYRISGQKDRFDVLTVLQDKIRDNKIGLIIAVNQAAVDFIAQEGHNLIPDAPMIIPIYEKEPVWIGVPRQTMTIISQQDAEGTLRYALDLFPKTKRVVTIMGKDDAHKALYQLIQDTLKELPHELEIQDTFDLAYEEMLQYVASLPGDTIAVYGSYFIDITGRSFIPAEVAARIADAANIPVFAFRDIHINQGLTGGSVYLSSELGKKAAEIALDYVDGKIRLSQQSTTFEVSNIPLFDWQQIKRWGADPGVLPEETVFLNYTPTLWESQLELIIGTGLFIAALIFFIILLFIANRKQRRAEKTVRESEFILKSILEYSLAGFWDWDLVGKTEYLSPTFKKMFGYEDYEIENTPEAWQRIIFPEDIPGALENFDRHIKSHGREPYYNEVRYRHKDGSTIWVICTGGVIEWAEDGTPLRMIGCHVDITERKKSEKDLLDAYDATINGWSYAVDLKDHETENHSRRVTDLTLRIAEKLGVHKEDLVHIRRGAFLHDIGKMGIPDSILLKPGKLNDEEWGIIQKHPVYAFEMLSSIDYLSPALDIPFCHHEKWDGSGYPRKLKGEDIPLSARIFAVVDVYDALTSDRPYRKAWTKEKALEYIKEQSGRHFDPRIVEVFMKEIQLWL